MRYIEQATVIEAVGNKPKLIEEFIGKVNTITDNISIAKMKSPEGWTEPFQTPEFEEYTVVLNGTLRCEFENRIIDVHKGQSILVERNEKVKYSTPFEGGAEYMAICLPAFSPDTVHREE